MVHTESYFIKQLKLYGQNPSTTFNNHWRPPKTFCVRRLNMYYIGSYVFLIYLKITNSLTINRNSVCIKNIFAKAKKKKRMALFYILLIFVIRTCFISASVLNPM